MGRHWTLAALIVFAISAASPTSARSLVEGRVVGIVDGDTLTVLVAGRESVRVRLAEIDAPESPGQPFSRAARQRLGELCAGQSARVDVETRDRYGRIVGTVECAGRSANATLVQEGLAWVYVRYARPGSPLFAIEREARAARRGLWADASPLPPWDYRGGRRAAAAAAPAESPLETGSQVRGNRNSRIYHLAHCSSFEQVGRVEVGALDRSEAAQGAHGKTPGRPKRRCWAPA